MQRNQKSSCHHSLDHRESKGIPEKASSSSLAKLKLLTVWITTNRGKFLKRWENQTTLPISWETYMWVKKQQLEPYTEQFDWFRYGKGVRQGCILSLCLFNLNTEYIMWHAGLDEAEAGIKIARRNIYKLRWADDTTVMVDGEEKLKSLLMMVKEEKEKS